MTRRGKGKLDLDPVVVRKARSLARKAGKPIVTLAKTHTTVSVERAVLRLAGLSGADSEGEPWVNHVGRRRSRGRRTRARGSASGVERDGNR